MRTVFRIASTLVALAGLAVSFAHAAVVTNTVDSAGDVGLFSSMRLNASGFPVIAYQDVTNTALKLAVCGDAACSTSTLTVVDNSADTGQYASLALNASGFPVISYFDASDGDLKLAVCGNATCTTATITTVDASGASGRYSSLQLNASGFPVISYNGTGSLKVAVCNDATCTTSTITTVDPLNAAFTSLQLNGSGFPVISYYDIPNTDLKLAVCADATCSTATIRTLDTVDNVGQDTSLRLATGGNPVISYYDGTNGDLKLVVCADATCASSTIRVVDATGIVGLQSSLMLTGAGVPIIVSGANPGLRIALCADATCSTSTNATLDGVTSRSTSAQLDATGRPVVSYRNQGAADLKVAMLTAATVTSVAVPANASYGTGQDLNFTVNWSEAVTVTGTPRIALTIGAATRFADYVSGTGTSALLFRYTVASPDNDTNGITVGAIDLNGGTIKDALTFDATLTLNAVGPTGSVLVDTISPSLPAASIVVNNQADPHTVTLTFSENLAAASINAGTWTVTGNGGTPVYTVASATAVGANGVRLSLVPVDMTNAATRITTAQANAHLRVTPPAALTDVAGNAYANGTVTEAGASHLLDTTVPTIGGTSIAAVPGGATVSATASEKALAYWIAVPASSTPPTPAQVRAGVNYGAVVVTSAGTAALPNGTPGAISVTGLSDLAAYDIYVTLEDAAGTFDNVLGAFTRPPSIVAPGAPTIGSATAGNLQATVTFTAPASNGGSAITSYTATSSGGQTGSCTAPCTSVVVAGLTNGTPYTFTVRATNIVGQGPASAPSNSVTPAAVPGAPTIGTATTGNTQATVTFTAAADNGSPISVYTATSSSGQTGTCTAPCTSITVTGLTNGTAYTFTVTATNPVGVGPASAPSNSVTPRTIPGAPTIGAATPGNLQAAIAFTPPASNGGDAITSYTATCNPGAITGTGAASPVVVNGLTNGTTYTCSVAATNAAGAGPASATVDVVPSPMTRTYSAPSATGSGTITATFTGGGGACSFTAPQFIPLTGHVRSPPAGTAPASTDFPHGLFDFTTTLCTPGSTITVSVTYPTALPAGTQYWKYGPTPSNTTPHWYTLAATIAGNTATFNITDGQIGDDDLAANGTIVDQGGPGVPGAPGTATAVPTLSEWMLMLLATLMLFAGARFVRLKN